VTAWRLQSGDGSLREGLYASQSDAHGEADHGDEAVEVEIDPHTVAILAPWLLEFD
jgi:hypothetical protein